MPGFKAAGLPALLVYRGGQMLTQALRVTEVMPKRFGDIDVAKLLQASGETRHAHEHAQRKQV